MRFLTIFWRQLAAASGLMVGSLATFAQSRAPGPVGKFPPVFAPADVFALRKASDVQISPDGRQIAYVQTAADVLTDAPQRSVWLLNVATGRQPPVVARWPAASLRGRRGG